MLTENMEDYLEIIYRLSVEKGYVRAVDISERLGLQASSITRMIQKMHGLGFLRYEKYRTINLTPKGNVYGQFLVWRDQTLEHFLRSLSAKSGIEEQVEGIEHYITPATMSLLRNFNTYFADHPQALSDIQRLNQNKAYPDGEDLRELCAWSFKHRSDDD